MPSASVTNVYRQNGWRPPRSHTSKDSESRLAASAPTLFTMSAPVLLGHSAIIASVAIDCR